MPLDLNVTPKPDISFTQPDGITAYVDTPGQVELMLTPRAVGPGRIHLQCIADEVVFRKGQQLLNEITLDFQCHDVAEHQRIWLDFVLITSQPSNQPILIRFDAWAFNAQQQKSPPILQLPVTLLPREAKPEDSSLPSSGQPLADGNDEQISPNQPDSPHDTSHS